MGQIRKNIHLLLILGGIYASYGQDEATIEYYKEMFVNVTTQSKTYKWDTDASRYKPTSNIVEDYPGDYDFVVVGAGAAGSVVASRLSDNNGWKVLLLEAGTYGNNATEMPIYFPASQNSDFNWGFTSTPQKRGCLGQVDQKCAYARGRGVGGSSLINGMLLTRGHPKDYDNWSQQGNPGWSYEEVLPFFKKMEKFHHNNPNAVVDSPYHGFSGNVNIQFQVPNEDPRFTTFLNASSQLGYHKVDVNGPEQLGLSEYQCFIKNGKRFDSATAYLDPVQSRNNLQILTDSYVIKVIIENETAKGVLFSYNNQLYRVNAKKEVILSAGTVGTPHIMMHSGLGPESHLEEVGIPLIKDLEVGSSFMDQPVYYGLMISINKPQPMLSLTETITEYLKGALGPLGGTGFVQTKLEKVANYPDIELIVFVNLDTTDVSQCLTNFNNETKQILYSKFSNTERSMFSFIVVNLRPKSRGTIRLKSSNPYDYPDIDPNVFAVEEDQDTLYEGIKLAMDFLETDAMKKVDAKLETLPLEQCSHHEFMSKEYIYCSMKYFSSIFYHPVASCPMGPESEKGAVVDKDLAVYGVQNLRIVDASVIPVPISGHTFAASTMVGEKGADIIKNRYVEDVNLSG